MKHLYTASHIAAAVIVFQAIGCSEPTTRAVTPASISPQPIHVSGAPLQVEDPSFSVTATAEEGALQEVETASPAEDIEAAGAEEVAQVELTSSAAANLELKRLEMARGVERYEPVGAAEEHTIDGRPFYAFLQVANSGATDQQVAISYEREDGLLVGPAFLNIPAGSRGYRTFTRTHWLRNSGQWKVSVHTLDGHLLGETEFTLDS